MEEKNYYKDLNGQYFIGVAENQDEIFIAPVEHITLDHDGEEIRIDYKNIKAFKKDDPGYTIEGKVINIPNNETSYKFA